MTGCAARRSGARSPRATTGTGCTTAPASRRAVDKLKKEIAKQGGLNAPGLEIPEVHVKGDINTPYRCIGGTIYIMQRAGFPRVGFISEPPPGGGERL